MKTENSTGRCHFEVYLAKRAMKNPTSSHTSEHIHENFVARKEETGLTDS